MNTYQDIRLYDIVPSGSNPRKNFDEDKIDELAVSIREFGILEPLVVRKVGTGYGIIAGERRWRAAAIAGLKEVPCIVRDDISDEQEAEIMLIENLQRQDLDPVEEAQAYKALLAMNGYTQESLGEKLGVSQGHI
ncbi:MAG: ParB/RepB/Spo0J family partition protein, partial [Eubacteriales bacterium]